MKDMNSDFVTNSVFMLPRSIGGNSWSLKKKGNRLTKQHIIIALAGKFGIGTIDSTDILKLKKQKKLTANRLQNMYDQGLRRML